MKRDRSVQWMGNNQKSIDALLSNHMAATELQIGHKLRIHGLGLETIIDLGDFVIVDGDRIGIRRAPVASDEFVTWTGKNLESVKSFTEGAGVRFEVHDERLDVMGGENLIASLSRGDRITKQNGNMTVTRAGEHHRI